MTSQGHPHTVFRRAIDRGILVLADATARELGRLTLVDALDLTALIALEDPRRHRRAAGRWLQRYMTETAAPTLDEAALVVAHLARLGGPSHAEALVSLRAMAERASSAGRQRGVP